MMMADRWESVHKMSQEKNMYNNIIYQLLVFAPFNTTINEVKIGIALLLFDVGKGMRRAGSSYLRPRSCC